MAENRSIWLLISLLSLLCNIPATTSDGMIYITQSFSRANSIPDVSKKTHDFIEKNGYVAETHEITTEDGYILLLHRIPQGRKENQGKKYPKPVVVIQHGISGSSDNWVLGGPKSFPLLLADAGYDVWLINGRGCSYSKRHRNMTVENPAFWDFSFHEQGMYDIAASIDYALQKTGQQKVFLMGHSRGTTSSFVLLSMRPEYNDKVRLLMAYAPVAYVKHAKSPLLQSVFKNSHHRQARKLLDNFQVSYLPGLAPSNIQIRSLVCGSAQSLESNICLRFLFLVNGADYELLNSTIAPVIFSHFPDGGGMREFLHYIQLAKTDRFSMYDMERDNPRVYRSSRPPNYPLSNIIAPVSFHYADNDYIVSKQDMFRLIAQIRNVAGVFRVPHEKFNHVDFMWGNKADELVYKPTMKLMSNY